MGVTRPPASVSRRAVEESRGPFKMGQPRTSLHHACFVAFVQWCCTHFTSLQSRTHSRTQSLSSVIVAAVVVVRYGAGTSIANSRARKRRQLMWNNRPKGGADPEPRIFISVTHAPKTSSLDNPSQAGGRCRCVVVVMRTITRYSYPVCRYITSCSKGAEASKTRLG